MNQSLKMQRLDWVLLAGLATLWGSSFLLMKIATTALPVFTVVLGRIGIAALLLLVLIHLRGLRLPRTLSFWAEMCVMGLLRAALPVSLFVWASTQIDSNVSGILNSTTPLFTAIIAHVFTTDEKLNRQRVIGIMCGMLGIVVLVGVDALAGLGQNVIGQLAVLCATCSYGLAGVYGRSLRKYPVLVTITGMLLMATLLILPIAIWQASQLTLSFTAQSTAAILTLATLNTAVAYVVWLTVVQRAGAYNASQVTFGIPFIAIVLGYLALDEQLGWNMLVGLLLVLFGLAVAQGRLRRRRVT